MLTHASFLVFHGGSGSSKEEIREAVTYGVVKMNVDTDTQVSCPSYPLNPAPSSIVS